MSRAVSPSTGRRYGMAMVAAEWELSRGGFYRRPKSAVQKRGPKTSWDPRGESHRQCLGRGRSRAPFVGASLIEASAALPL
jgi:hypothetical protein